MQVVKKCLDLGAQKALYVAADMAEMADAEWVVAFAEEQLHGLDYIVLNHIGSSQYGMWDGDVAHVQWLMQVRQCSGAATQKSQIHTTRLSLFHATQVESLAFSNFIDVGVSYFMDVGVRKLHNLLHNRSCALQ